MGKRIEILWVYVGEEKGKEHERIILVPAKAGGVTPLIAGD